MPDVKRSNRIDSVILGQHAVYNNLGEMKRIGPVSVVKRDDSIPPKTVSILHHRPPKEYIRPWHMVLLLGSSPLHLICHVQCGASILGILLVVIVVGS
jgi:hypothetical protein